MVRKYIRERERAREKNVLHFHNHFSQQQKKKINNTLFKQKRYSVRLERGLTVEKKYMIKHCEHVNYENRNPFYGVAHKINKESMHSPSRYHHKLSITKRFSSLSESPIVFQLIQKDFLCVLFALLLFLSFKAYENIIINHFCATKFYDICSTC